MPNLQNINPESIPFSDVSVPDVSGHKPITLTDTFQDLYIAILSSSDSHVNNRQTFFELFDCATMFVNIE